ncbi:MAG: adenylate/guanylate cyclase domain-containing protein [Chloroflexi bacterium]|nr:adenylate/guanylate cyclase domain-containing protein [Chloroflexota bacterium]
MRLIGKHPATQNPNMCNTCFDFMIQHRGGAEIDVTMLFADVRGSTRIAETMSSGEFHALLQRFYRVATDAVFSHNGSIDKFVGDEVVAMFFPLVGGDTHPSDAVTAARALMLATGHGEPGGPWLPVGAGVHLGPAWVGTVGDETHVELTALGDAVNTASRLASAAAAGEILVSLPTALAAGLEGDLPRETIELKGKQVPIEVVRLTPGSAVGAPA